MHKLTIKVCGGVHDAFEVWVWMFFYQEAAFKYAREYLDRIRDSVGRGITYSVSSNKWHKVDNTWTMSATTYASSEDKKGTFIIFTIEKTKEEFK